MYFNILRTKKIIVFFIIILSIISCASKKSDPVAEEEIFEPDPQKRARAFADKGGGLFGDINNLKKSTGVVDFASSNVMWRATLKSLDFLPLINADYSGGVIIYDWYSDKIESKEQIKISVRFLSNELRSDSISIIVHKKICESSDKCSTIKLGENFSSQIKESILTTARSIKIDESKKTKN